MNIDKEKQQLIEALASKMATNDLMRSARIRYIEAFADELIKLLTLHGVMRWVLSANEKPQRGAKVYVYNKRSDRVYLTDWMNGDENVYEYWCKAEKPYA